MRLLFSANAQSAKPQLAPVRFEFIRSTVTTVCVAETFDQRQPDAKTPAIMQYSWMKLTVIFVILSCQLATAQSNFFPILRCKDRTYTNATIDTITPATVTVSWEGNGVITAITNLPDKLQSRYHYNRQKAQKYLAGQAAEKDALQAHENQESAALAATQNALGPPQNIRIVKALLFPGSVQIEADGVLSEANIPNLPPEILIFIQKLGQAQVDAANLKQRAQQVQHDADRARGIAEGMVWYDGNYEGQNIGANLVQADAREAESNLTSTNALLHKLQDQAKDRTTIIARPTGRMITPHIRQWQFQEMAGTDLSEK